ncbi:nucleotide pyrophosphohydrolase [Roseateles depolymerans]|uniref:Mazg nucleotide pyrophosphohydrolase n=1 Tax=Roseateles depolymerans TaxID=76731 RepID=A0A0U3LTL9_9BURK|nr:nucleotide pyrophosphohydrolase [Roseateles depolymerans]ALV08391.1 Mazg nucleotide pyrophosphohydrolase [Roseateles depolymerans]REG21385.1 NTP pyrophosphatase (non-canonical NTP hydrolase) [Roseateles depolymerans]
MNLGEVQAELRHFAAERDWQQFHTPKNLSTALMVEAAELAAIFQWQTPEESRHAHLNAAAKQRIGEGVADVLLHLLQVADHCQIDVWQAVWDKLSKNAIKHPARHTIARKSPTRALLRGTHVLLDYENVQPSDAELRALVPDAAQVWVFHGPHQVGVEQRFASFGAAATSVPIAKTGKNALDFHLSFYMGYIASRNADSKMVVVANDKGYEPMLAHARALGFSVRRQPHGKVKPPAKKASVKNVAVNAPAAKKAVVKVVAAKKPADAKAAPTSVTAKKAVPAKKLTQGEKPAPAKKSPDIAPAGDGAEASLAVKKVAAMPKGQVQVSAATLKKLTDSLRKMGDKRPVKPTSLWRSLKSFLGANATEEATEVALARLIESGVVRVDSVKGASYPMFA